MDLTQKRINPNKTSDDGLGRGMEFAILVLMFLGIGYGLDRWLDTKPVFMISLVVIALIGQFASMWYSYSARMKHLEQERIDNRRTGRAATS